MAKKTRPCCHSAEIAALREEVAQLREQRLSLCRDVNEHATAIRQLQDMNWSRAVEEIKNGGRAWKAADAPCEIRYIKRMPASSLFAGDPNPPWAGDPDYAPGSVMSRNARPHDNRC